MVMAVKKHPDPPKTKPCQIASENRSRSQLKKITPAEYKSPPTAIRTDALTGKSGKSDQTISRLAQPSARYINGR